MMPDGSGGGTAPRPPREGAALALLLDSLIGPPASLLGLVAAVLTQIWSGGRSPALPSATLAALVANHFLLPRPQGTGTLGPIVCAIAYALEWVLAGTLLSAVLPVRRPAAAAGAEARPRRKISARDEGRHRLLLESSHQSRQQFRLLVEGVKEYGIFLRNPAGCIISWSAGAERLLGYPGEGILGRSLSALYPGEDIRAGEPKRELGRAAARGRCEGEGWRLRRDGSRLWAHFGLSALRDEAGDLQGFAAVVRDLTERKQAEEALRRAHAELEIRVQERTTELAEANVALREEVLERRCFEAASRAKDQFLAILSHELRTPLTPVLLTVSAALEDQWAAVDLRPMLEMIRRNIELEARLVDDLLDMTRAAGGRLTLGLQPVDAHAALHETLTVLGPEIRAAGLELSLELAAPETRILADPTRLQQVFWNLIGNALKFTPRGGSLTIRTCNPASPGAAPTGGRLVIEIADDGVGIALEILPRIFESYEQGDSHLRRRPGGLGLGLAISRSVAEAHGSRLTATSAGRDRGTTFTLELATTTGLLPESPNPPALPGVSPSDLKLPDGCGLDLMRELGRSRGLPGITLSRFGSEENLRLSWEAGFAEHLTKPLESRQLVATIPRVSAGLGPEAPAPGPARPELPGETLEGAAHPRAGVPERGRSGPSCV